MSKINHKIISSILVLISLSIGLLTLSCTNKKGSSDSDAPEKVKVIDLESAVGTGKIVNLSDVAHDIRYVKLETNDSSLIGTFPKAYYENGRIYVVYSRMIKVFDKDGRFLFKFNKKGRGPNEYTYVSNIMILPASGNIFIQSIIGEFESKLFNFNNNGEFLESKNLPGQFRSSAERTFPFKDSLYVCSVMQSSKDSVMNIAIIYDSSFNIIKSIPSPYISEYVKKLSENAERISIDGVAIKAGYSIDPPVMYNFKDNIRFMIIGNDTIFSLNSKLDFYPELIVNFGKFKIGSIKDINRLINLKNNYFIESEDNMILQFNLNDYCKEPYEITFSGKFGTTVKRFTDCYALYNKKSGAFTLMNQPVKNMLGFREDIKNGPPFLPTSISSDFQACALFTASQIIEYAKTNDVKGELKEILKDLKDTDNPIVAIARMK